MRTPSVHAFWASWAVSLQMVHERHLVVVERIVDLEGGSTLPSPSWRALSRGARPPDHDALEMEHGILRRGWQHEAASRVERRHR